MSMYPLKGNEAALGHDLFQGEWHHRKKSLKVGLPAAIARYM